MVTHSTYYYELILSPDTELSRRSPLIFFTKNSTVHNVYFYQFHICTSICTLFERSEHLLSNILFLPDGKPFNLKNSGIGTCATKYHREQFVTIGGWDKGAHGKVDRWGTNLSFLFPHN